MSAFFSNIFTLILSKIAKNAVFSYCCEISIAEVRLRFNLVRNSHTAIAESRCASTESTSLLRKLRSASKIKINYVICAAFLLIEISLRYVALRF